MSSLCTPSQASPIRTFARKGTAFVQKLNDLMMTNGNRDLHVQQTVREEETDGLFTGNLGDDQPQGRRPRPKTVGERKDALGVLQYAVEKQGITTWLEIPLDVDKILAASGKRRGQASQKAVMGNVSATEVSLTNSWLREGSFQRLFLIVH